MAYSTPRRNPYIVGRPIEQPELFFGREELFHSIEDNLRQNEQVILLHGQRRIGKSSLSHNIRNFVSLDEFVFVPFDLEEYVRESLSSILANLAKDIIDYLEIDSDKITLPGIKELEKEPYIFSSKFLPQIYEELGGKNLVLLLDEFDALSNDYSESVFENLFLYLQSTIELQSKLFVIIFVGCHSADIPNLLTLFKDAPYLEIGLLDEVSAKRLITQPAEGILEYEPEAIQAILKLSAGHPYFTQVICFALFGKARELEKWHVTREDVEGIVEKAIELAEAGLAWIWEGLSIPEKVIFSAVAESQKIAIEKAQIPENPLKLLKNYRVQTDELNQVTEQLLQTGFLDDRGYRVKVELIRWWLVQRHPLRQEIRELEKLDKPEVNSNEVVNKLTVSGEVLALSSNDWRHRSADIKLSKPKSILLGIIAAGAGIIALVSVGIYQGSTPCKVSENKVLSNLCIADKSINISRGDRTFFPNIKNPNRDAGIEAFKKGNYSQASEFFEKAVAADRKDPEVLIYYNNALARQKGTTITLAAVVPADNNKKLDQEILRGVAQAQNQFNKKGGLNSELLEIVIANDSNEPDKAKQVAQQLVKDPSVVGVIGHSSSDTTRAALAEYEKANLAIISPTSTSIVLNSSVFFRTVTSDAGTGKKLAEYAVKKLGLKKVVIFFNPGSLYSTSLREEFTNYFEQLGGEVVRKQLIDLATPTLDVNFKYQAQAAVLFPDTLHTDVALKIATANADLVNSPQNPNKQGLKLLGGDTLYTTQTLKEGGKAVEGLILAVPWFRDAPQAKNFNLAAKKQWEGGEVSWRTATSFDATQAFIKALFPNPTRLSVLQRLRQVDIKSNETSGQSLQFTQTGERQSEPILVKVEGGKFQLVR